MIDYEKLKEAHKLMRKITKYPHIASMLYKGQDEEPEFCFSEDGSGLHFEFQPLDDLIDKLKALTKPKPKYNVGDEVWHLDSKGAWSFTVNRIAQDETGVSYEKGGVYPEWFLEESLYPSKESLIKSQIEYWQSLEEAVRGGGGGTPIYHVSVKNCDEEESEQCEHESDGKLYANYDMSNDPFRCAKCGEYYR